MFRASVMSTIAFRVTIRVRWGLAVPGRGRTTGKDFPGSKDFRASFGCVSKSP